MSNGFSNGEQAIIERVARATATEILKQFPRNCPVGIYLAEEVAALKMKWWKLMMLLVGSGLCGGGFVKLLAG